MTINVSFVTVADSISKLSISGVTVKDLDGIPENAQMLCPILYPKPDGFISEIRPDLETFGTFGSEQLTLNYTLTWRYLHSLIAGGLGGLTSVYATMIANIELITEAILTNDTLAGATNIRLSSITAIGPVSDPAGNIYHGCDFVISVQQYIGDGQ